MKGCPDSRGFWIRTGKETQVQILVMNILTEILQDFSFFQYVNADMVPLTLKNCSPVNIIPGLLRGDARQGTVSAFKLASWIPPGTWIYVHFS